MVAARLEANGYVADRGHLSSEDASIKSGKRRNPDSSVKPEVAHTQVGETDIVYSLILTKINSAGEFTLKDKYRYRA